MKRGKWRKITVCSTLFCIKQRSKSSTSVTTIILGSDYLVNSLYMIIYQ
jgi:hypothetical protein